MKEKTEFGKFLRRLRGGVGDWQMEMCKKLETSPAIISNIESGSRKPPLKLVDKIIEKYELSDKQEIELLDSIELTDGKITVDLSQKTQEEKLFWIQFMKMIHGQSLSERKATDLINFIWDRIDKR